MGIAQYKKKPEYNEEDISEIIEWMRSISEFHGYHIWTEKEIIYILESDMYENKEQWSTGGFEFKKYKKGLYILPSPKGKFLVSNSWRKKHPSNKLKPGEIKERLGHTYKCPVCKNYVYNNGYCSKCGYSRPTDKVILELWNNKKSLKEIQEMLREPNLIYIKSRLKKYNLWTKIDVTKKETTYENVKNKKYP